MTVLHRLSKRQSCLVNNSPIQVYGTIIFHLLLQFTISIISHQAPAVQKLDSTTHWITQWAISEFSRASVSKRGSVLSLWYENDF